MAQRGTDFLGLNVLDDRGEYWYLCCICGELLYSEWTVAGTMIKANGEYVAFCVHHNKEEIENLQEWAKTISFKLNDWNKGVPDVYRT